MFCCVAATQQSIGHELVRFVSGAQRCIDTGQNSISGSG